MSEDKNCRVEIKNPFKEHPGTYFYEFFEVLKPTPEMPNSKRWIDAQITLRGSCDILPPTNHATFRRFVKKNEGIFEIIESDQPFNPNYRIHPSRWPSKWKIMMWKFWNWISGDVSEWIKRAIFAVTGGIIVWIIGLLKNGN